MWALKALRRKWAVRHNLTVVDVLFSYFYLIPLFADLGFGTVDNRAYPTGYLVVKVEDISYCTFF